MRLTIPNTYLHKHVTHIGRKRKTISRAWSARAPSTILPSPRTKTEPLPLNVRNRSSYRRVHRIKVDEKAGLIMATSAVGGLVVRDLESDKVLWELPVVRLTSLLHFYMSSYVFLVVCACVRAPRI